MALGILGIMMIVLIILAIILQILLYIKKSNDIVFGLNVALGVFLSYLNFSSLPTNFTGQKVLTLVLGAAAILSLVIKIKKRASNLVSRLILSVSIAGLFIMFFV